MEYYLSQVKEIYAFLEKLNLTHQSTLKDCLSNMKTQFLLVNSATESLHLVVALANTLYETLLCWHKLKYPIPLNTLQYNTLSAYDITPSGLFEYLKYHILTFESLVITSFNLGYKCYAEAPLISIFNELFVIALKKNIDLRKAFDLLHTNNLAMLYNSSKIAISEYKVKQIEHPENHLNVVTVKDKSAIIDDTTNSIVPPSWFKELLDNYVDCVL